MGGSICIIEVNDLVKNFGDIEAVKNISFEVGSGEIFGLLGPNGAGKTTTVGVITSEVKPTLGEVVVDGVDVEERPLAVKKNIGVIPQHRSLDRKLTGWENVWVMANAYGVGEKEERIREVLELVGLSERANDSIRGYSGGMLQRLLVARALVHDPDVLFLDEPTMGLDPQARRAIWKRVKELNSEGKTILLTTHYMEEADALCDRIAIMNKGRIVERGSPEKLKSQGPGENVIKIGLEEVPSSLVREIRDVGMVSDVRVVEGSKLMELHIFSEKGKELSPEIVSCIKDDGMDVISMDVREPTLEDIFINLTGEKLE
ncbi:export ABC transporter ATP-binding protein [archaeon SCG-AAA382B04]|nr:export ABC transporter ATP-binding protein [archaeon SCG-AAA382B04]